MRKAIVIGVLLLLIALTHAITPFTSDEIQWRCACHEDETASYEAYVNAWPDGRHAADAQARYDEHAWADARAANTAQGFEWYVLLHGKGKHIAEAKDKMESLHREEVERSKSRKAQERAKDKIESLHREEATAPNTVTSYRGLVVGQGIGDGAPRALSATSYKVGAAPLDGQEILDEFFTVDCRPFEPLPDEITVYGRPPPDGATRYALLPSTPTARLRTKYEDAGTLASVAAMWLGVILLAWTQVRRVNKRCKWVVGCLLMCAIVCCLVPQLLLRDNHGSGTEWVWFDNGSLKTLEVRLGGSLLRLPPKQHTYLRIQPGQHIVQITDATTSQTVDRLMITVGGDGDYCILNLGKNNTYYLKSADYVPRKPREFRLPKPQ